jgi:Holliday junction resolvasome RuvABC endonuclease subunit
MVIDPGVNTGWSIYDYLPQKLLGSGCIYLTKAPANRLTYLESEFRKILTKYQPDRVYKEKKYGFVRGRKNVRAIMIHTTYHDMIEKIVSEWGVPLIEIDTRRWAKKKVAQVTAREITGRKRISTHESETICWGRLLCMTRGL